MPEVLTGHATKWWHVDDRGKVVCDVCPRRCALNEGQRGLCFVRGRANDAIVLTTYGRSSGFCVDPIEKKPLNHFLPGTPVLSFGTAGCNLACKFCQNWSISKSREVDTLAAEASPEAIARSAADAGCRSVAYTYNDPIIFMEYAVDVAAACRARGIKNVAVTAGYVSEGPREEFFGAMDAANVDLKAWTERFYKKLCGGDLETVKETLKYLVHETDVWVEITTLVIEGENDDPAEIDAMTGWVATELGTDVPLHFSAFHPDWKMMDSPRTSPATLARCREQARANGLRYVYTGNVHDRAGDTTICPGCQADVIVRDWYTLLKYDLKNDGTCGGCGERIAGVFEGPPGDWGSRRRRLKIV